MSLYLRLSTQFLLDPKIVSVGPVAGMLYVRGLLYSKEQQTDGFVPWDIVKIIGFDMQNVDEIVAKLVDSGLWKTTENGYEVGVEKWSKYQTTKDQNEAKRAFEANRKAAYREAKRGQNDQRETRPNGTPKKVSRDCPTGTHKKNVPGTPGYKPEPKPKPNYNSEDSKYPLGTNRNLPGAGAMDFRSIRDIDPDGMIPEELALGIPDEPETPKSRHVPEVFASQDGIPDAVEPDFLKPADGRDAETAAALEDQKRRLRAEKERTEPPNPPPSALVQVESGGRV